MTVFPPKICLGEGVSSVKGSRPPRRFEDVLRRRLRDETSLRRLERRETSS